LGCANGLIRLQQNASDVAGVTSLVFFSLLSLEELIGEPWREQQIGLVG
jgi:hypothetical protein